MEVIYVVWGKEGIAHLSGVDYQIESGSMTNKPVAAFECEDDARQYCDVSKHKDVLHISPITFYADTDT
jgi:hypothetical protein